MTDSTPLRHIGDESAARAAELEVERDAAGEGQKALSDAGTQVLEGARSVALQGVQVQKTDSSACPDRRGTSATALS